MFSTCSLLYFLGYSHGLDLGIICKTCKKWFSTGTTFLKHRIWHHKDELTSFKYNCPECPYASNAYTSFKKHRFVHDTQRIYFCSVCGNRFLAMSSLGTHMLIHTGEKRYN